MGGQLTGLSVDTEASRVPTCTCGPEGHKTTGAARTAPPGDRITSRLMATATLATHQPARSRRSGPLVLPYPYAHTNRWCQIRFSPHAATSRSLCVRGTDRG